MKTNQTEYDNVKIRLYCAKFWTLLYDYIKLHMLLYMILYL